MKFVLSLLALSLLPAAAHADCTLNYKDLKSALDVAKSEVKSKSRVRYSRSGRSVSQSVVMKNDQAVSYVAGGCEHFSYTFTYAKVALPSDAAESFARASALLAATPVTKEAAGNKESLLQNLADAQPMEGEQGDVHYFSCGDASCYVGASEQGDLLINYMFAL